MSSKLNSDVRYAYMHGGATWECSWVKADMVLFAGDTSDPYLSTLEAFAIQIDFTCIYSRAPGAHMEQVNNNVI